LRQRRLTKKDIFARHYLETLNATNAAIESGYSAKSAYSQGSRLLRDARVQELIKRKRDEQMEKLDLRPYKVLRELSLLAFSNMQDYIGVNERGQAYIDLSKVTRDQAAAIQEITSEEFMDGSGPDAREIRKTRLKIAGKRDSLELLGKYLNLFHERPSDTILQGKDLTVHIIFDQMTPKAQLPDAQRS
jgi:phage terminase small subunit